MPYDIFLRLGWMVKCQTCFETKNVVIKQLICDYACEDVIIFEFRNNGFHSVIYFLGPFKNPSLSWMIGFLFVVSFLGLFSVVPLRKVFIATALILGDGLYNFFKIPTWFAVAGYVAIAAVSTATVPHIFPELKWYHILVIYIFAPALAFSNAYGCGLTDFSLAYSYGTLAIFAIGAWAGASHGGVLAGLAACGVMMNIVSTASDLSQDFKTGYLTLSSPRSMFVSQLIGTAMGCIISPCVFWLFLKAFKDLGTTGSEYPAPYATVFRNMAIMGVEGFSSLPENCLYLCYGFFGAAILINLIKDALGEKWARFIPNPMAMAIPFYIGSYFAIDACVGSLILFIWEKMDKAKADAFGPVVASGLICGDGIWTLPSSVLALAGVKPPICMKFLSRGTNAKVDAFLGS
ncbi:metal-nicotianamine transporter YSL [Salix suchowensis]|nr:metal-nicotianamine transporter YSL [Salix suchowensis]